MRGGLAVDIGGTKILLAPCDDPDSALRLPTDVSNGPEGILAQILSASAGLADPAPGPVVVAMAGDLDVERGIIHVTSNLPFREYPIVARLTEMLGRPVALMGDAVAATVAELTSGAGAGRTNGVYVTVSTGVGMGVVRDGRLDWTEGIGDAELGHTVVDSGPDALLCGCGRRGCLEAYASGTGVVRRLRERRIGASGGEPVAKITHASQVTAGARAGEADAGAVVEEALGHLSWAIARVVRRLRPEVVVIGGGFVLYGGIFAALRRRLIRNLADSLPDVLVEPAAFGASSALQGAAAVGRRDPHVLQMLGGRWARSA